LQNENQTHLSFTGSDPHHLGPDTRTGNYNSGQACQQRESWQVVLPWNERARQEWNVGKHDMKAEGKDAMSCCKHEGKEMSCCEGKEGKMACMKGDKDKSAACCGGDSDCCKDGKGCCSEAKDGAKTAKNCCGDKCERHAHAGAM
jgi:hypothetical protein